MRITEYMANRHAEAVRLANAKTAIATAIEGKGVTVPEGTKLDGMAALVEAISAGGVAPDFGYALDFGTMILANNNYGSNQNIETNLSKVYAAFVWCPELFTTAPESTNTPIIAGAYIADSVGITISKNTYHKISSALYRNKASSSASLGGTTSIKLTAEPSNDFIIYIQNQYYIAGYEYRWIAWGDA